MIVQKSFIVKEETFERELFSNFDENIKLIEETLKIDVILREGNIVLMGEEKNVNQALKLMTELHQSVTNGKNLDKQSISYSLSLLLEGSEDRIKELEDTIVLTQKGKAVQPKTLGQKELGRPRGEMLGSRRIGNVDDQPGSGRLGGGGRTTGRLGRGTGEQQGGL